MVDHGVHGAGVDAKEEPWRAKFGEVAQIVSPVGLRDDGHTIAVSLKHASYHGGTHRRVVDVGIATEQDYVDVVPSQSFHLLARGGQP